MDHPGCREKSSEAGAHGSQATQSPLIPGEVAQLDGSFQDGRRRSRLCGRYDALHSSLDKTRVTLKHGLRDTGKVHDQQIVLDVCVGSGSECTTRGQLHLAPRRSPRGRGRG